MQITKKNFGPLLIITAALLWALDGVIRRYLYSLPPVTIIFFEHLIGTILLFPFFARTIFKVKFSKREWFLLILVSILSGLLGTLFFTTALLKVNFISFSVVFLLQKLQPIFAILSARIFLKEKFKKGYLPFALLALISAYFVTFSNGIVNLNTGEGTVVAALFALGAAVFWGTSTTFSKMLLTDIRPEISTFYRFLITTILSFILIFILGKSSSIDDVTLNQYGFLSLIAVSTGMVALLIYYRGLKRTPVHVATILELVFPLVAIIIDMKLYGNVLSITQWIAGIVLIFSVYKISKLKE